MVEPATAKGIRRPAAGRAPGRSRFVRPDWKCGVEERSRREIPRLGGSKAGGGVYIEHDLLGYAHGQVETTAEAAVCDPWVVALFCRRRYCQPATRQDHGNRRRAGYITRRSGAGGSASRRAGERDRGVEDERSAGMKVEVVCYSGYKVDQRPVGFRLGGRDYSVEELLDQWYGPRDVFFKVKANDGNVYILRRRSTTPEGEWSLESFRDLRRGA